MPTWPANGETDWNEKMLAFLSIGHDTDGTHKASQMLTDMGWSPTSYTGGESITLPNGMIMKTGYVANATTSITVTFAAAFPNAIVSVNATVAHSTYRTYSPTISAYSTSAFTMKLGEAATGYHWFAIGY